MYNDKKKTTFKQGLLVSLIFVCVIGTYAECASTKQNVKEGKRLYEQEDFLASESKFMEALITDPESDIVNFNLGTALYKNGDYKKAVDYFQKAFLSENEQLKQNAYYNLGNTFYKIGLDQERENELPLAIPSLEKSIKQYERTLAIDETDEDARHNFDFVRKELKRLKQIQQQQQQQGQRDQSEDSKQQKQPADGQQPQSQQGQQDQQSQESQQPSTEDQGDQQEQGFQEQQEDQEQSDQAQGQGQKSEEGDENEQNSGANVQSASELTEREARMLLESYQQTEEPQGILNMQKKSGNNQPVTKDW